MDVMGKNRGGSGRPASLLLWALLAFVLGGWLMLRHWEHQEQRQAAEAAAVWHQ